jgi:uncharacterized protein (DUF58 family)
MRARLRRFWRRHFTPTGTRFLAITLAVGFAAINTGNNLLYLVLAMLLSLVMASGILSLKTLRGLRVERAAPDPIHAGKPITITYRVENTKRRMPSYSITLEEDLADGEPLRSYLFRIGPRERTLVATRRFVFPQRGAVALEAIRVVTTFPFGFVHKRFVVRQPEQLVIYPQLAPLPEAVEAGAAFGFRGRREGRRPEGSELRNLREYVPGEDARAIHWKASARAGRLLLREFEQEEDEPRLWIVLPTRRVAAGQRLGGTGGVEAAGVAETPPTSDDAFERAVMFAAALARAAAEGGSAVGLWTENELIPQRSGPQHLRRIYHALAFVQPSYGPEPSGDPRLATCLAGGAAVVLAWFDPFWDRHRAAARLFELSAPALRAWPHSAEVRAA